MTNRIAPAPPKEVHGEIQALHFAVSCPACQKLVAVPIPARLMEALPAVVLRALGPARRQEVVTFCEQHEGCGGPGLTPSVAWISLLQ